MDAMARRFEVAAWLADAKCEPGERVFSCRTRLLTEIIRIERRSQIGHARSGQLGLLVHGVEITLSIFRVVGEYGFD